MTQGAAPARFAAAEARAAAPAPSGSIRRTLARLAPSSSSNAPQQLFGGDLAHRVAPGRHHRERDRVILYKTLDSERWGVREQPGNANVSVILYETIDPELRSVREQPGNANVSIFN